MTLPIVVAAIALKLATDSVLDYLYPDSVADGTLPTTAIPSAAPYVPPFLGGQCNSKDYRIQFRVQRDNDVVYVADADSNAYGFGHWKTTPFTDADLRAGGSRGQIIGAILGIASVTQAPDKPDFWRRITLNLSGGRTWFVDKAIGATTVWIPTIHNIITGDGTPDNCGNLPNPSLVPPPDISTGGAPQNPTLLITPSDTLVEAGLPVVVIPPLLSALAALAAQIGSAIAAAQAAAECLAAVKAVADAVKKLADALDIYKDLFEQLRKYLNKREKEEAAKKQYYIRQYGTILRDGYLDIARVPLPDGFTPLMIDLFVSNVPLGLGRFFGKDSYNWFRYTELGYISFISATSGVLSTHKIEHLRTSISVPELAKGFTYHLGLNGVIRARVSLLYTQEKP